jgi:lysophospholipid acyltransferase 7
MAVSAYWHGLHLGYYLSMLTTTPCVIAENILEKEFKNRYLKPAYFKYYEFFGWLFRTRMFDYMSIGFILLTYDATIKFWTSVYFVGHLTCGVLIGLGFLLRYFNRMTRKTKTIKNNE